ncbi:MAG: hypothetical protein KJO34_13135 [Deltaproteobacteria bacterium]|nr:hypothetical protein [Deltaproteobacteria bacterium]
MNAQMLMGQIANKIVAGKFENHIPPRITSQKMPDGLLNLIQQSMNNKVPPPLISADALDKAMADTIKMFETGEFLLPDLIVRAMYTSRGREVLADFTGETKSLTKGTAVMATIAGKDYMHWEEVVEIILKGLGYKTINLGDELFASDILRAVNDNMPDMLWINTPSTSIPEFTVKPLATLKAEIKEVTEHISDAGLRNQVTILVGGIDGFCNRLPSVKAIDADFCCGNVIETLSYLRKLVFSTN